MWPKYNCVYACVGGRGLVILRGEHLDMFFLVCCGCCHCLPQSVSVCVLAFHWFSVSDLSCSPELFGFLCLFVFLHRSVVILNDSWLISHLYLRWGLRFHTWLRCDCGQRNSRFSLKHAVPVCILRPAGGGSSSAGIFFPWLPSLKWSLWAWWSLLNGLKGNWAVCTSRTEMRGDLSTECSEPFWEPQ